MPITLFFGTVLECWKNCPCDGCGVETALNPAANSAAKRASGAPFAAAASLRHGLD